MHSGLSVATLNVNEKAGDRVREPERFSGERDCVRVRCPAFEKMHHEGLCFVAFRTVWWIWMRFSKVIKDNQRKDLSTDDERR